QSRRTVERTFLFDADRHEVRMTTGGSTVTLPLVRSARDPVTALFYVRTLPLAPGLKLRVPLTDNGRRSQLDVAVGTEEAVMVDGRERRGLRIAPQSAGRVERQEPLAIAVWVSADEHRIPLVVEVAGTFGKVRAEMVSYTS